MRRRYRRELFAKRVEKIKNLMPFAGLGADVIAGFPGETESDFEDTCSFLDGIPFSYLHVFSYSERPGTIAQSLPLKVSPEEKEIRSKRLIQLSEDKNLKFNILNINHITNVLFERSKSQGMITGLTENYIRVEYPWQERLAGQIKKARLTGLSETGNMTVVLLS
jgi:threonylcarbamoyladenosine tRNA methylthiotransferase MtaB